MTTFKRVQGDLADELVITLDGIDSLSTATTVVGHVWQTGVASTNLTGVVSDAPGCEVTVSLGAGGGWLATATPGDWYYETEVTFNDGSKLTWPAGNPDTLRIRAQGA